MRTAFIVLALATVCLAAAIENADVPVAVDAVPANLAIESEFVGSDVADVNAPHSRAKRTLLLKKLKLAKLAKLALLGKVAKVAVVGTALGGLGLAAAGGLGGHGGQQNTYSSNNHQSYGYHSQAPAYVPDHHSHSHYGGHSVSGHTEYIVSYAPSSSYSGHSSW